MGQGYSSSEATAAEGATIIVPTLESEKMYLCSRCREYKTISQFHSNTNRSSGIGSYCKDCNRDYLAERTERIKNNGG